MLVKVVMYATGVITLVSFILAVFGLWLLKDDQKVEEIDDEEIRDPRGLP